MHNRSPQFEWQVLADDTAWQTAQMPTGLNDEQPRTQPQYNRNRRLLLWSLLCGVLCVVMAGYLLVRRAEAGLHTVETQVQQAVEAEAWTGRNQQTRLATGGSNDPPSGQAYIKPEYVHFAPAPGAAKDLPAPQVEIVNLQDNRVMARVRVEPASLGAASSASPAYRETRFYRQTADGWQRTALDSALLDLWRNLETIHFHIHFPQVDDQAVKQAGPRLDALYEQMRKDYGLPANDNDTKVTLEVAVPDSLDPPPVTHLDTGNRTITVTTPTLLEVPEGMADADILFQSVIYPLSALLQAEALQHHEDRWRINAGDWRPLLNALDLWQMWHSGDGSVRLLAWRSELFGTAFTQTVQHGLPNAGAAEQPLCAIYQIWGITNFTTFTDLACSQLIHAAPGKWSMPLEIRVIPDGLNPNGFVSPAYFSTARLPTPTAYSTPGSVRVGLQDQNSFIALEAVIDYAAATYGRERLPALFEACGVYSGWDDLIPALFGVSPADFEQGWQAYIAQRAKLNQPGS